MLSIPLIYALLSAAAWRQPVASTISAPPPRYGKGVAKARRAAAKRRNVVRNRVAQRRGGK